MSKITQRCNNCGQEQTHPAYLWKVAIYKDRGEKIICPACAFWLDQHPEAGRVIAHQVA